MIEQLLHTAVEKALQSLYGAEGQSIQFQKTRKDFDGDIFKISTELRRGERSVRMNLFFMDLISESEVDKKLIKHF